MFSGQDLLQLKDRSQDLNVQSIMESIICLGCFQIQGAVEEEYVINIVIWIKTQIDVKHISLEKDK
jgi:hypothetical protein